MAKKQYVKRYNLIINRIRKNPCSFDEIAAYLARESSLDEENYEVSLRTFQRDIREIASIYNIEIVYNRSRNVYEINGEYNDERNDRIMESFEVFNALNLTSNYSQHILLEKRKPLGTEHLYGLLHAIRNRLKVSFNHEKFWDDEELTTRLVQPLALKEARHRWYLVAKDSRDARIKTFGLERISNLEIRNDRFVPDATFDAEEYFKHSFGVIREDGIKPQKIVLSFTPQEAKYIKSLPLHHSQRIVSESETETVFELYLYPTYDFTMEILSYGDQVKVLEPMSLRKDIVKKLKGSLSQYDK